jgi:hypothetical protein
MPLDVMVPAEADHVTAVLVVPETVAENCCFWPVCRLAAVGEIVIVAAVGGGVGVV